MFAAALGIAGTADRAEAWGAARTTSTTAYRTPSGNTGMYHSSTTAVGGTGSASGATHQQSGIYGTGPGGSTYHANSSGGSAWTGGGGASYSGGAAYHGTTSSGTTSGGVYHSSSGSASTSGVYRYPY